MTWEEVKNQLDTGAYREITDVCIINRTRPWIFNTDDEYSQWRMFVAQVLGNKTVEMVVVGSAATGFSLSPRKAGRPFKRVGLHTESSDIDIAILDRELFEVSWNCVIAFDREFGFGAGPEANRTRLNVYNGFVAGHRLPRRTDAANWLARITVAVNRTPPFRGYPIRFRIYRRLEDLRAYHMRSLQQMHRDYRQEHSNG